MKFDYLKDCKVLCFAAGIAAAVVGKKVISSPKTREVLVNGLAKGMQFKADAQETLKNMKEDAQDICYEAKAKLKDDDEEEGNLNEI